MWYVRPTMTITCARAVSNCCGKSTRLWTCINRIVGLESRFAANELRAGSSITMWNLDKAGSPKRLLHAFVIDGVGGSVRDSVPGTGPRRPARRPEFSQYCHAISGSCEPPGRQAD